MALVEFIDDSAPYLNASNLNNNFNELNNNINNKKIVNLYDGKVEATNTSFNLSQPYDNFDMLVFTISVGSRYKGRVTTVVVMTSTITSQDSLCLCYYNGTDNYAEIFVNTSDKTTITTGSTQWGTYFTLNRVDGIKL